MVTNYEFVLPHFLKHVADNSLLLYDEAACHLSTRILEILGSKKIDGIRIPTGTTKALSPIETYLQKIIKSEVRGSFANWCIENFQLLMTQKDSIKKPFDFISHPTLAGWVLKACKRVTKEQITNSFINTGYNNKEKQDMVIYETIPKIYGEKPVKYKQENIVKIKTESREKYNNDDCENIRLEDAENIFICIKDNN